MPEILGRLEVAQNHGGVAVLWDHYAKRPLTQFPLSTVKDLLGMRNYGYWWVELQGNTWHFREEVPREGVEVPAG